MVEFVQVEEPFAFSQRGGCDLQPGAGVALFGARGFNGGKGFQQSLVGPVDEILISPFRNQRIAPCKQFPVCFPFSQRYSACSVVGEIFVATRSEIDSSRYSESAYGFPPSVYSRSRSRSQAGRREVTEDRQV